MDSILKEVSKAISIRTTAESMLLEIIEDAMLISEENLELKSQRQFERGVITNSLRRDWQVIKYRRNPSLSITNPISGVVYEILLQQIDRQKLEKVGYDVIAINPGTTITHARHTKYLHPNLVHERT